MFVTFVNIHAAKTHLSRLVEQAANGEDIVLGKAGKPMVRLVPYAAAAKPRTPGLLKGKVRETPDCWAMDNVILDSVAQKDPTL